MRIGPAKEVFRSPHLFIGCKHRPRRRTTWDPSETLEIRYVRRNNYYINTGEIKLKKPKAILFDLGDTLLRSNYFKPIRGVKELLKIANNPRNISADEIQSYAEQVLKDLAENGESKLLQLDNKSFTNFLYGIHDITFDKTPEELDLIFLDGAESVSLIDGVTELLDYLKDSGVRLAILSNTGFSESAHRTQLNRRGIEEYFEFFIATSDYCIRKPDKRIFDLALSRLHLTPEEVWYVGNKFEYDIVGANDANMFPIWLNEKQKEIETGIEHLSVKSHDELLTILKEHWAFVK